MFKKPSEVKALQRLSGADRKKLRRTMRGMFKEASEEDLDLILPPKAEVMVARLTNRAYVYTVEGGPPMLFDVDGRGNEIFPTVYALWKVPTLLPAFMLKGGEVSRYVLGGADLMFPGIYFPAEEFPSFTAGEPWAVKVPGNPAPIAVGVTTLSSSDAVKAGLRGKALRIAHYYRDTLWESAEGCYVPNGGFLEDMVCEDPVFIMEVLKEQAESSVKNEVKGVAGDVNGTEIQLGEGMVDMVGAAEAQLQLDEDNEVMGLAVQLEKLKSDQEVEEENEAVETPLTIDEMDALLDKCLLQALHTTVKEKDLPMTGSNLWSGHILPCRPAGTSLDLKKSSYKKLAKWLQAKSAIGLISSKEDKHRKEVMLMGFNRGHPEFITFKPEKRAAKEETNVARHVSDGLHSAVQFEVLELWKPTPYVNPIFQMVGTDLNRLYTTSEAVEVAFTYVEKENLVKREDKAFIVLDATLCDALYKGTVRKGASYPTEIHKKDLGATFLGRMQAHYKVTRGNETAVKKGALKSIQIVTERRQGNKKVTKVSGTEAFLVDADLLAGELQKKFACSTSVGELPGKKGQFEVLVQGGVLEDLGKHLVQQYGIPKKYIEVLDKTRK